MIGRDYESGDLQMTKYFKNRHKKSDSNESLYYCSRTQIIELLQELPLLDQVELLQYGYQ
ncbi:hypothetical protein B7L31_01070 [Acinetobacter baumannii]|nr:hypothetical protein B7L31_01070 [Acinetobacter baumannii]